jgi:hypothetical protein
MGDLVTHHMLKTAVRTVLHAHTHAISVLFAIAITQVFFLACPKYLGC